MDTTAASLASNSPKARTLTVTALVTGETLLESFTEGQVLAEFPVVRAQSNRAVAYWVEAEHAAKAVRNKELSGPSDFDVQVWDLVDEEGVGLFARAVLAPHN
ncbi:hypothetical protein SEA_SAPO_17 [Gordonia phage Sapo]|nr:hypothetical protein SEA_SAPO_17 [Gordonia phage Sapo]